MNKISCRLQYIDRARFMLSSFSNLVNNVAERIHRIHNKKYEKCGTKYKYCGQFLEYSNIKDDLIEYKIYVQTKIIKNFDENLIFCETYKFCNHDNNTFISFL